MLHYRARHASLLRQLPLETVGAHLLHCCPTESLYEQAMCSHRLSTQVCRRYTVEHFLNLQRSCPPPQPCSCVECLTFNVHAHLHSYMAGDTPLNIFLTFNIPCPPPRPCSCVDRSTFNIHAHLHSYMASAEAALVHDQPPQGAPATAATGSWRALVNETASVELALCYRVCFVRSFVNKRVLNRAIAVCKPACSLPGFLVFMLASLQIPANNSMFLALPHLSWPA